jgi:hypothetical protein
MKFTGEEIMSLLATWRKLGQNHAMFMASASEEHGDSAYVFDRVSGETLQFVSPEGMRN